jgi:CRP-like cAMP-binding protein
MAMKDWFGGAKDRVDDEPVSADVLITEGKLDEAEGLLRRRLKQDQGDIYSRLKLAEVLMQLHRQRDAVDEYLHTAESYARDGFFDKATALLRKISKLAPLNDQIALKIAALQKAKTLERRRELVLARLNERDAETAVEKRSGTSRLELQQMWADLSTSTVIEALSDDQLKRLFSEIEIVRFEEQQQVVAAGEELECIYIGGRGQIEAKAPLKGETETTLGAFTGGHLIGDRALLEHQPWPAKYVATKRTATLQLTREGLAASLAGEVDPKGFLDSLRMQKNDHKVALALREMEA